MGTYKNRHKNMNKNKTKKNNKKKLKNKKFIKDRCAPSNGKTLNFTCYTEDNLLKLKEIWNKKHSDSKITSNNPKTIWKALKYLMKNTCDRESCWLKHECHKLDIPKHIFNKNFAPKMPNEWKKKPTTWLNTLDIMNVMKQWEKVYKNFSFIGPSPIDYDHHMVDGECVWEELCHFNLKYYLDKGINKIGIIFNLDKHDKDGSHWVALFIDISLNKIYYFDSYGDKHPRRIKRFINKVIKQFKILGMKCEYKLNTMRHQYSDSECGMYSLYFIIQLLKGNSLKKFNNMQYRKIPDKYMKRLRKKYFNI